MRIERIVDSEMPHNIVGDLTSPSTVHRVTQAALRFVRDRLPAPVRTARGGASPAKRSRQSPQRPRRAAAAPPDIPSGITATWPR